MEGLRTTKFASPNPLTFTAVGTADAGTSIAITCGQSVSLEGDLIQLHSEGLAGVANIQGTTAITTQGKSGFTTGSYDITLYALVNNKVLQSPNGVLMVETK